MSFAVALSARARELTARGVNESHDAPAAASSVVRAAVEDALARGETHYTDRPGVLALRELVAVRVSERFGVPVNARADVLITCGVEEARFVATQQLLLPGDTVAGPACMERLAGVALLRRARVAAEAGNLLYLASSTPEALLRETLAGCPAAAAILYEIDEQRSGFHPAQVESFAARTTTIGPLGAASWRAGYLVSPPAVSASMRDFKQALTICSTNLSQWALLAALGTGEARI